VSGMGERDGPDGATPPQGPVDSWLRRDDGEPEPDWAEEIRAGRRARGDRLRDVFATFEGDEHDPEGPPA